MTNPVSIAEAIEGDFQSILTPEGYAQYLVLMRATQESRERIETEVRGSFQRVLAEEIDDAIAGRTSDLAKPSIS